MITQEQEQFIINHFMDMTYKEIGNAIGKSENTIAYYVKKNNLGKKNLEISDDAKKFIIDNYKNRTYREIGNIVGLEPKQIEGWLRNHLKEKQSKYRMFNSGYFKHITTGEQAYWLGYIYADGWINMSSRSNGYSHFEFGMELQREDEYILEKLNNVLGNKHIIKHMHNELVILNNKHPTISDSSVLRIYSKELVCDLFSNGIDVHKSTSDIFPIVDDELFPDFLRGYIDGDGCIYKTKKNHLYIHITGANKKIFEYISYKLDSCYGIHTRIYNIQDDKYRTKYRLCCFRCDSVKRLLNLIYHNSDSIKLERKYQIYKDFYGLAA